MRDHKYCQEETAEFVERMDAWLARIARLFRSETGTNYVSSVLMGGYGKGWGAMSPSSEGPLPVNDLDIAIVTKDRLGASDLLRLHELATQILNPASQYDMRSWSAMDVHADVMNFCVSDFQRLQPTQFHLDLTQGSRVFDGDDVLAGAVRIGALDLDKGDALRLVFNHVINLFEPCAVGNPEDLATRTALFFTATKAAVAAGSAVIMINGQYHTHLPERFEALRALDKAGIISEITAHDERFVEDYEQYARDRALATEDRVQRSFEYYMRSRDMICSAARYCVSEIFRCKAMCDICGLADDLPNLWVSENVETPRGRLNCKSVAKKALQAVGLRAKPVPWRPRAVVYAAGLPLLAAFTYNEQGLYHIDSGYAQAGKSILADAGIAVGTKQDMFAQWQECGRAAVGALKSQNWIR